MKMWRLWAKALGQKASKSNKEADRVAIIRTFIFISYFVTNLFIIAGVLRHWNDNTEKHYEVSSYLSQTEKERILKANRNFLYD